MGSFVRLVVPVWFPFRSPQNLPRGLCCFSQRSVFKYYAWG